jgi:hypothetical protein
MRQQTVDESIPWKVFVETAVILSAAGVEHFGTRIKCPV